MEITWYGLSCFRLADRGLASVVTDPYGPNLGLNDLKLRADIVTVSHDAIGHNHSIAVSGQKHVLTGPGEFEIGNVFVTGITTARSADERQNVVFVFEYNEVTVAHLGDIQSVPVQTQIEDLEQINILLVPVGDGRSLNAAQAAEVVSMLEPNIVIPMHYHLPGLKIELEGVERFLKEMGVTMPEAEASLKISQSNLPEETEVVLLIPRL